MTSFGYIHPNLHRNGDGMDPHPIQFIGMRGFNAEEIDCSSSVDDRQKEEDPSSLSEKNQNFGVGMANTADNIASRGHPRSRRRRRPRAEAFESSIKQVEQEKERYENFLQRIEALEQTTFDMISSDHVAVETCEDTQKLMAEIEEQQKSYYITLEEAKKDQEMITNRMDELSKIENSVEGIIEVNGWSTAEDDTLEAGHTSREREMSSVQSERWPGALHEITTSDFCDEISEVSISSYRYNMYYPTFDATTDTIEKQYEKYYDHTDATAESTVISSGSAASSVLPPVKKFGAQVTPISTLLESETEDSSSPLAGASFFYSHNYLGSENGSDGGDYGDEGEGDLQVSELLEEAKFIHRSERHLILSPTPFVRTAYPSTEDRASKEIEDDEDVFCFRGSRKRSKPGQWAIFRRSQQDIFVPITADDMHTNGNGDTSGKHSKEILCFGFGGRKQHEKHSIFLARRHSDLNLNAFVTPLAAYKDIPEEENEDVFCFGVRTPKKQTDVCSIFRHHNTKVSKSAIGLPSDGYMDDSKEGGLLCIGSPSSQRNHADKFSILRQKEEELNAFIASSDTYKDDSDDEQEIFCIGGPRQRNKSDECALPCIIQ
jgi:hypothetical protein